MKKYTLLAFDLDGTITQHKSPMEKKSKDALIALGKKYSLLMVGSGTCARIFQQMEGFPIDVIGNYGMQEGKYNAVTKNLDIVVDDCLPCDKEIVEGRIKELRHRYGFTSYKGESVQYYLSGCITFPILGTEANLEDKLSYDPDRKKRRDIYNEVCEKFPEYNVFVGGSSSFDMAPKPFDKYNALKKYCARENISVDEVLFVGDDYGVGGNDESVYRSKIDFLRIDDYRTFAEKVQFLLEG